MLHPTIDQTCRSFLPAASPVSTTLRGELSDMLHRSFHAAQVVAPTFQEREDRTLCLYLTAQEAVEGGFLDEPSIHAVSSRPATALDLVQASEWADGDRGFTVLWGGDEPI